MGLFYDFISETDVQLIGVEAAGRGIETEETAATINRGSLGIFHGMKSYFMQDKYGQIAPVSYTHLRAHETRHDLVCRLLLEKKKTKNQKQHAA